MYLVFDQTHCIERAKSNMTWDGTVLDIANLQFEGLSEVIELATGRDVTAIMVREAATLRVNRNDDNDHGFGVLVELTLGTRAARPFLRAA